MAWTLVLLATSAAGAKAPSILAIGETLYDSLPHGVFLGGAPLNVAVHAAQLGAHAAYASAASFFSVAAVSSPRNAKEP